MNLESNMQSTAFQECGTESMSVAEIQAALDGGNESFAHYCRGSANWKRGYKTGAIEDFTKAIKADPKNLKAYRNRGVFSVKLWMEQERNKTHDISDESRFQTLDTAIQDLTYVAENVETMQNYKVAHFYRGLAKFKKADRKYKTAFFMPNEKQNLMYDAIRDFTAFIKEDTDVVAPYFFRGLARYAVGDFRGTVDDFEIVADMFQDNPEAERTLKYVKNKIAMASHHLRKQEKLHTDGFVDKTRVDIGKIFNYFRRVKA